MKSKIIKTAALSLCAVLTAGAVGGAAFAFGSGGNKPAEQTTVSAAPAAREDKAVNSKDETVYVIAGADGSVKKVIVSEWLKNALGEKTLGDSTELSDIVNVKGDESYTDNGGSRVWNAEGNDIYYQGDIDKELPVAIKVSYTLDGKSISPDELKGRSGRVTIRFDYENKQYEIVKINDKEEKIYVPFAMLTGMILDNDTFRNVEISNGRLINDGSRTIAAGIAFPGLQEDLGIDREKLDIPDYFEITADADNFSLGMTVTLAANEIFSSLDTDAADSFGDIKGSLAELTDAMKQLIDGSSKLYDGLCTLLDKSAELVDGINKLAEGAGSLKKGAEELDGGAGQLSDGTAKLSEGLDTLAANNDALNGGAKQVFDSLLATAETQLTAAGLTVPDMTVDNYADVLSGVIASLDKDKVYAQALGTVTDAVEAKRGYITEQVTAAVKAQVEAGVAEAVRTEVAKKVEAVVRAEVETKVTAAVSAEVESKVTEAVKAGVTAQVTEAVRSSVEEQVISAAAGMDKTAYEQAAAAGLVDEATQTAIKAAVDSQMQSEEVKQAIEQNTTAQMQSDTVKQTIAAQIDTQMQSDTVKQSIAQNTDAQMSSDTVKTLISSKTEEQMNGKEVKTLISAKIAEKMESTEIKDIIAENTEAQVQKAVADAMAGDEVQSKLAGASEGAKKVIALKTSLDSYKSFYTGLQSYTEGVAKAADGAKELKNGASKLSEGSSALSDGAAKLYDGLLALKDGMPALSEGITKLRDGSQSLAEGLEEFNEKGVQKLIDVLDGDLSGLAERIKATVKVSKNYRSFAGISDGTDGKVKFIYRTDSIE